MYGIHLTSFIDCHAGALPLQTIDDFERRIKGKCISFFQIERRACFGPTAAGSVDRVRSRAAG